jgi:hypothetical protein
VGFKIQIMAESWIVHVAVLTVQEKYGLRQKMRKCRTREIFGGFSSAILPLGAYSDRKGEEYLNMQMISRLLMKRHIFCKGVEWNLPHSATLQVLQIPGFISTEILCTVKVLSMQV